MNTELSNLKYDEKGLIPAIIQDAFTREVLMLGYMNRESLEITLREKRTCFFSRSRQELWRKGETSGHVQHVVRVIYDCDKDALLIDVEKEGPACHLGTDSCFVTPIYERDGSRSFSTQTLYHLLEERNRQRPEGSYTTYLFEEGLEKILKKVGEETSEVLIAAMKRNREETVYELADLLYHSLVLMVEAGISLDEIRRELASRHVIDHKKKQETAE